MEVTIAQDCWRILCGSTIVKELPRIGLPYDVELGIVDYKQQIFYELYKRGEYYEYTFYHFNDVECSITKVDDLKRRTQINFFPSSGYFPSYSAMDAKIMCIKNKALCVYKTIECNLLNLIIGISKDYYVKKGLNDEIWLCEFNSSKKMLMFCTYVRLLNDGIFVMHILNGFIIRRACDIIEKVQHGAKIIKCGQGEMVEDNIVMMNNQYFELDDEILRPIDWSPKRFPPTREYMTRLIFDATFLPNVLTGIVLSYLK